MQDIETLTKTGNWIQIFAIALIFLGGVLQISKFVIDKKLKNAKAANAIIEKEVQDKKVAELESRLSLINTIELHVFIYEKTEVRPKEEIKTGMGMQSAVAFFNKDNTRFRFITDFQFSHQQIDSNTNMGSLKYKPEEPSQIIGKDISFIENFEVFAYNYSDFLQYFDFDKKNKNHRIGIKLFINGIEVMDLNNIGHENGELYSGLLSLNLKEQFQNLKRKYVDKINTVSN